MKVTPFRVVVLDFVGERAWSAQLGRKAFSKLAEMVAGRPEPLMNLDMRGVELIDASCSREALASLLERHRGTKWFFLTGIANQSIADNIDAAFARKEMSIISRRRDGEYTILGQALGQHLLETLEVVEREGTVTSKRVCSAIKGLSLTACNNRLKDLSDVGVVARLEGTAESGGREYLYVALR